MHTPGHQHGHQQQQAAEGDDDVKRQRQHGRGIVRIQPGALSFARAEGEEVGEDLLVRDHPAEDGHQHHERGDAHNPAPPDPGHGIQLEMEAVQKAAATCFAHGNHLPRGSVQIGPLQPFTPLRGPLRAPGHGHRRLPHAGQADGPGAGIRRQLLHARQRFFRRVGLGHGHMQLGAHPVVHLVHKVAQGAGEEHRIEQPAQQQSAPGMEPRHRLAQSFGFTVQPHA